jgi:hypothetical protein
MTGAAVLIRSKGFMESSFPAVPASPACVPIKQAWAAYVRNRWRKNTLWEIQREWGLSEGEARNLLYGAVSLRTLEKIGSHRNGGLRLELHLLFFRWRTSLEGYAQQLEQENERERLREDARLKSEGIALSRLASCVGLRAQDVSLL